MINMKITFQDPLDGQPYNPSNKVPSVPGVYIYGLLLAVKDNDGKLAEKFLPYAVGESNNLHNRLIVQKYKWLKKGGNGTKELFDFSSSFETMSNISLRYSEMDIYDSHCGKSGKLSLIRGLSTLVYFQDSEFFNFVVGSNFIEKNIKHLVAINNLTKLEMPLSTILADAILATKMKFQDNFYFIYATDYQIDGTINTFSSVKKDPIRLQIETDLKFALKKINIHTTEPNHKDPNPETEIDLSFIHNSLINLTKAPFPIPLVLNP